MKRTNIAILVWALCTSACDQNKSGPVEPTAEPATTEAPTEPAPPTTEALFATAGPAAAVPVGTPAKVDLTVTPSDGFKINKQYDWNFEFQPHPELEFGASKITSESVVLDDASAKIPLEVTAKSAGEHTVKATGNFSVCNDDKCELYRNREVTFAVSASDS